ncbi:hypothetical protein LP417_13295 [Polaromonas sp. P1-6]|nr:hypothetical protein LP417_13295 [Polaromonas sp. P1-6]
MSVSMPRCLVGMLLFCVTLCAQADYHDTSQSKLEAARKYADDFLKEDARPGQQFFTRDPKFPVWKDQPAIDCGLYAIMRAIQTHEPYFEDKNKNVVVVPVWVELLTLNIGEGTGYPFGQNEEGVVQCKFEYEQYSFRTKQFEKIPDLLKKPYLQTFKNWGELVPRTEALRGGNIRDLAIDLDKRYVRFKFRISVAREAPYQLYPQFPRHHPVAESIQRTAASLREGEELLRRSVSDRDSSATGDVLQKDLARMRRQDDERRWRIAKLLDALLRLESIPSFSDLQLQ